MARARGIAAAVLLALLLAVPAIAGADSAAVRWPDGPSPPEPVAADAGRAAAAPTSNPVALPFLWMLRGYGAFISPLDGTRCGMYPTCSAYAAQAVRRHGPLVGGMLAADRLLHEGAAGPEDYPVIERFGRRFIHDPVSGNDWMFRRRDASGASPSPSSAAPASAAQGSPAGEAARSAASGDARMAVADPETAHALARRLADSGSSWDAITEYRRAAFLAGDAAAHAFLEEAGWTALQAAVERRRGAGESRGGGPTGSGDGAFEEADRLFDAAERVAIASGHGEAARRAAYGRAFAHLARGYAWESRRRFEQLASAPDGGSTPSGVDAAWLGAWSQLSTGLADGERPAEAAAGFAPFREDSPRAEAARSLLAEIDRASRTYRSPRIAAGLSLAVPGAGYLYAGRPGLAAGSFLLNATFIAATVWAVQERNWPLAAILVSFEAGWYVGGAGGAAEATDARNARARRDLEGRLRRRFMGTVWPGGAAAGLLF